MNIHFFFISFFFFIDHNASSVEERIRSEWGWSHQEEKPKEVIFLKNTNRNKHKQT